MPSFLTWLDHSEEMKRRMLDFIDMFSEPTSRDELGLGTIRDAFSELLFPGTSTIQTRARYFLFIPWMHLEMERVENRCSKASSWGRTQELLLIDSLMESGESEGVIGRRSRRTLQRLPSSVYWQGLRSWGIAQMDGSRDDYYSSLPLWYGAPARDRLNQDGEPIEEGRPRNWHPGLPPAPADFPRGEVTLELTRAEAVYLRDRIQTCHPDTLLAFLVARPQTWTRCDFCWLHPELSEFPDRNLEQVRQAHCFSDCLYGAVLLYNLLVAEAGQEEERIEVYRSELKEWSERMSHRARELRTWLDDGDEFWASALAAGARVSPATRTFVETWRKRAISEVRFRVQSDAFLRELVAQRERTLKRARSRIESQRARELWNGASGVWQMDFRWNVAQRILFDILEGLN